MAHKIVIDANRLSIQIDKLVTLRQECMDLGNKTGNLLNNINDVLNQLETILSLSSKDLSNPLRCYGCYQLFDKGSEKIVVTHRFGFPYRYGRIPEDLPAEQVNIYCPKCRPPYNRIEEYYRVAFNSANPVRFVLDRIRYFRNDELVEVAKDGSIIGSYL